MELYEIILEIPVDLELPLNCPVLDRLTISAVTYYNPEPNLLRRTSSDSDHKMLRKETASNTQINTLHYRYAQIYHPLANPDGWEWFNSVRNEVRFKAFLARIEKYRPENFFE